MNPIVLATHRAESRPDAATHWVRHLRAWGIDAHGAAAPDATAMVRAAAAHGVVIHCTDPQRLLLALRTLIEAVPDTSDVPVDRGPNRLSERERAVLCAVAQGRSNKEIARALNLVEGTVKNYLSTIFEKLDARDRAHAVMLAVRAGLLHRGTGTPSAGPARLAVLTERVRAARHP